MNTSDDSKKENPEKYMSFFDHLEELRARLLRSIIAIVLGALVSGIFIKKIFLSLTKGVPDLYWHTPLEPYFTFLKLFLPTFFLTHNIFNFI